MSKLEEAAKEYLEEHVCSRPNCSYDAFKSGASWQAEQAKVLENCMQSLINESIGFLSQANYQDHGITNMQVMSLKIENAKDALKKYRESKGGG